MIKLLRELFPLLSKSQRRRFYILQFLVVFMAFSELLGVASIGPFMALVGDPSILDRNNWFGTLYEVSGFNSQYDFIVLVGVGVFCVLVFSSVVSMYTTWRLSLFGVKLGTEISDRLFAYYMNQSWLFHSCSSSAQLTKQISTESGRLTNQVIRPLMNMNSRVVLILLFVIAIVSYDPIVALVAFLTFGLTYAFFYIFFRKKLKTNGIKISEISTQRYRLMNDGFGGIKDTLLMNRQKVFIDQFADSSDVLCKSISSNTIIGQLPRYFMEMMAFGSIILFTMYLIYRFDGNLGTVLPILSIYALAGFKLLPSFQQIYGSLVQIRAGLAAFQSLKQDLQNSKKVILDEKTLTQVEALTLKKAINLVDIKFSYPNKTIPAIDNVSITIPVNTVVGFVGASGSGKSTLIDIMIGLLKPQAGNVFLDLSCLNDENKRLWQNSIGLVSQSIFLSEGTISENVAFGIEKTKIDTEKVKSALKLAHLYDFVEELTDGIQTKVGERGVQLSGGQRQRVGIARALYHDVSVLVFDEATSALDGITEKMIMEAIHDFSGKKTIILIAHRLKTVYKCDQIFLLEKGRISDKGTYEELLERNSYFQKMAQHA